MLSPSQNSTNEKSETACEQYARASEYSEKLIVSGLARDKTLNDGLSRLQAARR